MAGHAMGSAARTEGRPCYSLPAPHILLNCPDLQFDSRKLLHQGHLMLWSEWEYHPAPFLSTHRAERLQVHGARQGSPLLSTPSHKAWHSSQPCFTEQPGEQQTGRQVTCMSAQGRQWRPRRSFPCLSPSVGVKVYVTHRRGQALLERMSCALILLNSSCHDETRGGVVPTVLDAGSPRSTGQGMPSSVDSGWQMGALLMCAHRDLPFPHVCMQEKRERERERERESPRVSI